MRKIYILILLSLAVSLSTWLFWEYVGDSMFYVGDALTHVIDKLLICIFCMATKEKWLQSIALMYLGFAMQSLCDELFFDPTRLDTGEILIAIVIVVLSFYKPFKDVWIRSTK